MKHPFSRFILLLCSVINTPVQSQTWTQLLDFPGSARDDAAGFIIGNTFYVGTGLDGGFNAQRMISWICPMKPGRGTIKSRMGTSICCGFSNANYGSSLVALVQAQRIYKI
jgi:hypothetical protein